MDDSRIPRQATQWELRGYKRKPGRPRKNWMDIIRRDLKDMDITWDEAEELTTDRAEWRQRVAQCTHLDAGWNKVLRSSCCFCCWINQSMNKSKMKGLSSCILLMELHLTATECHLPFGITQCYLPPWQCHLTQVNTPRLNSSQLGRYSIYLPLRDGRLSWPKWLVTYWDSLPAHRWSPIQALIRQHMAGSRTLSLLIISPTDALTNTLPRQCINQSIKGIAPDVINDSVMTRHKCSTLCLCPTILMCLDKRVRSVFAYNLAK